MPHPHNGTRRSRAALTGILTLLVALMAGQPLVGQDEAARLAAYIERSANGEIDWDSGIIYGRGLAYLEDQKGNRFMAERAAKVMAAANIVRLAAGIRLDDRRLLGDLGGGQVVIRLRAFLSVADHSSRLVESGGKPYFEVVRKTPITGVKGLTRQLLTRFGSSVSEGLRWPDAPASPPAETPMDDEGPWLVLDARHLAVDAPVFPALFPVIGTADGRALYDWRKVSPAALEARGMARYVVSGQDPRRWQPGGMPQAGLPGLLAPPSAQAAEPAPAPPRGRRRFIVNHVETAAGLTPTNLVISNTDAKALVAEDAASGILKHCRVIVIVGRGPLKNSQGPAHRQ